MTVKGSAKPIRLYTVDLCYDRLTPSAPKEANDLSGEERFKSENKRALNMEYLKEE